jgi:hypothetical protein
LERALKGRYCLGRKADKLAPTEKKGEFFERNWFFIIYQEEESALRNY